MNSQTTYNNLTYCKDIRPYENLPLTELARKIATSGHRTALEEFHKYRTPFQIRGSRRITFTQFLDAIFNEAWLMNAAANINDVWQGAQDLTVDKFSLIPRKNSDSSDQQYYHSGPDCRNYFAAFAKYAKKEINPKLTRARKEIQSAGMLQKFVTRHAYLSCLECKRQAQKLIRRYNWIIGNHILILWIPYEVPGPRCKTWLEENIPDVDPTRPDERQRVQGIIDQLLTRRKILSLDALNGKSKKIPAPASAVSSLICEELSATALSDVVAAEKAVNIVAQRTAIRNLGPDRLKQMIHNVFESLLSEQYTEAKIAGDFGLSMATFSRFAGSRWSNGDEIDPANVPDLWRNTAHILANHPQFMDAARKSATWVRICAAQGIQNQAGRRCHRE